MSHLADIIVAISTLVGVIGNVWMQLRHGKKLDDVKKATTKNE